MYNIVIESNVIEKIDNFIESYLNIFLSLIEDSGIDNIYLIEENYIKISEEFKFKILSSIKTNLKEEVIGKKVGENNDFSIVLTVGNYRLFINFKEDSKEKMGK